MLCAVVTMLRLCRVLMEAQRLWKALRRVEPAVKLPRTHTFSDVQHEAASGTAAEADLASEAAAEAALAPTSLLDALAYGSCTPPSRLSAQCLTVSEKREALWETGGKGRAR